MMYLEMKKDPITRSGSSWARYKCVWSPTRKQPTGNRKGSRSPFYSKILRIMEEDVIFHLIGDRPNAEFTGYSIASGKGFETEERPPDPRRWSYADRFYRADLTGTKFFDQALNLEDVFAARKIELKDYYHRHREHRDDTVNIFYDIKATGNLGCSQGAYLSDIDDELLAILFPHEATIGSSYGSGRIDSVETGTQITSVRARVGQWEFRRKIMGIYRNRCCFPGCSIADDRFLVAGHIDRWSDNESLRGDPGNGLCLCVLHDKAFEVGLFTLDDQFQVFVNPEKQRAESEFLLELFSRHGKKIKAADSTPLIEALRAHRRRFNIDC